MTDTRSPGVARAVGPADGGRPGSAGGPPSRRHAFGVVAWARWAWRQLTSMRTALVLLFLLAAASVPGSLLPQRSIDASAVQSYYAAHPTLAPIFADVGLFNVFAAPWFAAIYILLFVSLLGCVLPRSYRLARSTRAVPPRAPRNLNRLPLSVRYTTTLPPEEAAAVARTYLRRHRFRLGVGDGWISAEKGYRREVGNLVFHLALTGLLVAVAVGSLFGYKADRVLVKGSSFADTPISLDNFSPGHLVGTDDLPPFSIALRHFSASYISSGPQREQPRSFDASLAYTSHPGAPTRGYQLQVNRPLNVDGTQVYLIGHGYAPVFKVTDARGQVVYDQATPFVATNTASYLSEGVVKVPDAAPHQLGFVGLFVPTGVVVSGQLESAFPAPLNPVVSLIAYQGNLGMNSGAPQSVYRLYTAGMHRLPMAAQTLTPGQSVKLPGGNGTLTFTGYRQWVSLQMTHDPGQTAALVCAGLALAGLLLSFLVRRRRIFVRLAAGPGGATLVDVGGLARSDVGGGFEEEFADLATALRTAHHGVPFVDGAPSPQDTASTTDAGSQAPAGEEPPPAGDGQEE